MASGVARLCTLATLLGHGLVEHMSSQVTTRAVLHCMATRCAARPKLGKWRLQRAHALNSSASDRHWRHRHRHNQVNPSRLSIGCASRVRTLDIGTRCTARALPHKKNCVVSASLFSTPPPALLLHSICFLHDGVPCALRFAFQSPKTGSATSRRRRQRLGIRRPLLHLFPWRLQAAPPMHCCFINMHCGAAVRPRSTDM